MNIRLPGFVSFLFQRSRSVMAAMVCVGVFSGLCSAGVLALINRVLQQRHDQEGFLALGFVVVVAGKLASQIVSQLTLTRFAQDTTLDLSLTLCEKILKSPYRRTETYGHANILVTLTDDVSMLAWSIQSLPQLAMNVAIVLGCGVYLLWLSWPTFLLVVTATLLGAWGYHWLHTRAFSTIYSSREARAQLFRHFRSLTEGIKELTLHRQRRKEFIDQELHGAADLYRRTSIDAARQYAIAEAWSHFAFYSMIGVILFVFPLMFPLSTESLIGYVVVLLYMMSPIWGIIGILPTVERGQVAFENIQRLGVSLDNSTESRHSVVPPVTAGQLESLTLESVTFQYATDSRGNDPFSLGPISLSLCPGELSFVIGGNGSGKSTFVKLLAGLYVPHSGEVSLNGTLISDANRDWYREHFSVVFSDFYLFEKLLGIEEERIRTSAAAYLSSLQLDHKVEVRERKFSTVDLSQGQRKRLALLTAYLEDRPVYVFDEWAADQDPQYKDVFYMKLLPELRARGKSVVVITHDDRYFHLGDRVIKLENGKVVSS
ncbi:MAG: cyclic peptide export ABC transporter [Nitrospira sp.]|nr:MAG: cyclic peptide export ABC transporter [Nitrospira sp.]